MILGLIWLLELIRSRRYHQAMLLLFWAHGAFTSARHITIYALVAAPLIAEQVSRWWDRWTEGRDKRSVLGTLRSLADDMRPAALRTSIWAPVFLLLLACGVWKTNWPQDFPAERFPTQLIARNKSLLSGPGTEDARFLTQDIWGGYLDYRFYPQRRVFIDGRSDYYGLKILKDYIAVRAAAENWKQLATQYGWRFALVPPDWALTRELKQSPDWILRDQDKVALLFERRSSEVVHAPHSVQ
jgi:hypothetical protein